MGRRKYIWCSISICAALLVFLFLYLNELMLLDFSAVSAISVFVLGTNLSLALLTSHHATRTRIVGNTVITYEILSLLTYVCNCPADGCYAVAAFLVVMGVYTITIAILSRREKKSLGEIKEKTISAAYPTVIGSLSCILIIALFVFYYNIYVAEKGTPPTFSDFDEEIQELKYIEENRQTLSLLKKERFRRLSPEERLDAGQFIIDYEVGHRKLTSPLRLMAKRMGEKSVVGFYNDDQRAIWIDSRILKNQATTRDEFLQILLHEIRHAEQHDVTRAYKSLAEEYRGLRYFTEIKDFEQNFDEYEDASMSDFNAYYGQEVEVDARQSAAERLAWWIDQIESIR